jgi:hypothetical protein
MAFSSYEELMGAVEERREEILTLELDLGAKYSPEHEQAKKELAEAQAMTKLAGQPFLGDNIDALKARVAETKPEERLAYVQYKKLPLGEWEALTKANLTPIEQYERVLPKVFIGVFGTDPVQPEDWDETHPGEEWVKPEPLITDAISVSVRGGNKSILAGSNMHPVVQSFMAWQNSSGEVTIRPTKSGRD